jgi:hypothetical protein
MQQLHESSTANSRFSSVWAAIRLDRRGPHDVMRFQNENRPFKKLLNLL